MEMVVDDKPLVSVVTPVYKNYSRLYKTIKSVLLQDYNRIEFIIADDGSGDFPKEKVVQFIEQNKKNNVVSYSIIINEKNMGTVINYENAILKAKGKYILGLSCNDTFMNSHVISRVVNIFNCNDADVIAVGRAFCVDGRVKYYLPHIKERAKIKALVTKEQIYNAFIMSQHYDMFIGCALYFKKTFFEDIGGFDKKYLLLEDLPFVEKAIWYGKVELHPEIIAIKYDGGKGVSSKKNKLNPKLVQDITKYNRYGKKHHFNELDHKAQNHIVFGIKRAEAKNRIQLYMICLLYFPRILEYELYKCKRVLSKINDIVIKNRA